MLVRTLRTVSLTGELFINHSVCVTFHDGLQEQLLTLGTPTLEGARFVLLHVSFSQELSNNVCGGKDGVCVSLTGEPM